MLRFFGGTGPRLPSLTITLTQHWTASRAYEHDSVINDSRAAGGEEDTTQQEKNNPVKIGDVVIPVFGLTF